MSGGLLIDGGYSSGRAYCIGGAGWRDEYEYSGVSGYCCSEAGYVGVTFCGSGGSYDYWYIVG